MNWDRFSLKHRSEEGAFEAFVSQLFERWCHQTFGGDVERFYYLDGRGGDGGVEAFCVLRNLDEVGVQAKWFRGTFDQKRAANVTSSLAQAKLRHPRLRRYIVCLPEDLTDSKNQQAGQRSGLDRWKDVEAAAAKRSDVTIEFWGEHRLEQILADVGGAALAAYWFDQPSAGVEEFRKLFERTRKAWFAERYLPDLHCVGTMDEDIGRHLSTEGSRRAPLQEALVLQSRFQALSDELGRLPGLPGFCGDVEDKSTKLATVAQTRQALQKILGRADQLVRHLQVAPCDTAWTEADVHALLDERSPFYDFLRLLEKEEKKFQGYSPGHKCLAAVKKVFDRLGRLGVLMGRQIRYRKPLALVGDPGIGKTHALVACADQILHSGGVALVIPGRSVNARDELSTILANAIGHPGQSTGAVLDALEAATYFGNAKEASAGLATPDGIVAATPVALLVIDGIEEATNARWWPQRLTELVELSASRRRIRIVISTRTATESYFPTEGFTRLRVDEQKSVPLQAVFYAYTRHCGLVVDELPWLPWALRTPLAVRLFAELYRGQHLRQEDLLSTALPALIGEKIARIDSELRASARFGWGPADKVLLPALRALAKHFVESEEAPTYERVIGVIRSGHPDAAFMSRERANHLLEGAVAHGLLEMALVEGDDPLGGEISVYLPAFNAITDYLLASDAATRVREAKRAGAVPAFPPVLKDRRDAAAMAVTLLATDGHFVVQEGTWKNELPEAEQFQLRSLAHLPFATAECQREWVGHLLRRSMPTSRLVVGELLVWTARIPNHPLGTALLDTTLRGLCVSDRDLFWSGPDHLPANQGEIWEGRAKWSADRIKLLPTDRHDGMPLLLAWSCTTVVERLRRRHIRELAVWGAHLPAEMAALLAAMATVNDGQLVQDVAVAAAGAAMRCDRSDSGLFALATCADSLFFASKATARTHNAITRHAARVVIERARVTGHGVSDDMLQRARPPYGLASQELLPFDLTTLDGKDKHSDILWMDLEWYVAKRATEQFLEPVSPNGDRRPGPPSIEDLNDLMLEAITAGKIAGPAESLMPAAREELDKRRERSDGSRAVAAAVHSVLTGTSLEDLRDSEASDATNQPFESISAEQLEQLRILLSKAEEADAPPPRPQLSPEAQALLSRYAAAAQRESVHPVLLRNALIVAHVQGTGWNRARFIGDPNGGEAGEKLGADLAILRQYQFARQGERSPVAAFREKYVWDAVNTIAGYLADRLPRTGGSFWTDLRGQVRDYSELGSGMPEPFWTEVQEEESEGDDTDGIVEAPLWTPTELVPRLELSGQDQLEKAQNWLQQIGVPSVGRWPGLENEGGGRLVLNARILTDESESMVKAATWISAFAIRLADARLLKRDLQMVLCESLSFHFDGLACRIGGSVYTSPSLACWAPWLEASEGEIKYASVDEAGKIVSISLHALTARAVWELPQGEQEEFLPAPLLRDGWGIIDSMGDQFSRRWYDASQQEVAWYRKTCGPRPWSESNEQLNADARRLREAMQRDGYTLGWIVRVYWEIPGFLYPEEALARDGVADHRFVVFDGPMADVVRVPARDGP